MQLQRTYAPSLCDPLKFKCTTTQFDNEYMAYNFNKDFAGITTLQHVLHTSSSVAQTYDKPHLSNTDQPHLSKKHGFPTVGFFLAPRTQMNVL